jgi:hypothetical protein
MNMILKSLKIKYIGPQKHNVIPCTKVYFVILFLLGTFKVQAEQHKPVPL